jgi:signal transduction histidine kinase
MTIKPVLSFSDDQENPVIPRGSFSIYPNCRRVDLCHAELMGLVLSNAAESKRIWESTNVRRDCSQTDAKPGPSSFPSEGLFLSAARAEENTQALEELVTERTLKLQQTIADLEAFSYSISHDLRTPVGTIQGLAQLLQKDCGGQLSDKGAGYLDSIISMAARMDRLIQDVLTLSRVARDGFSLEPVDIERLMRDVIGSSAAFQLPQAEIEIRGPLPRVLGNATALTQCFSNLLGNAVKFVVRGTIPRVQIWAEELDSGVRLWFCDNGIGIAPKDHDRLFCMFEPLNSDYEGTGLGLAIVKKAAERMGATVGVQSELGKGSRFWVQLKAVA